MTLVLGVMAASMRFSSMFMVSGLMSMNFRRARWPTKAVAVEEKVNDGRMTSSPGSRWQRAAASSSALVPLVVSRARLASKRCSIHSLHCLVKAPSPQILRLSIACWMFWNSVPTNGGLLNEIIWFLLLLSCSYERLRGRPSATASAAVARIATPDTARPSAKPGVA